jgi:hypothetical protein
MYEFFVRSFKLTRRRMILISSKKICFTLCDAISEWGENFMIAHPIYKFEELEVTNSKHYQKNTN